MATINPRLNITLEPSTTALLTELAKREKRSLSSVAKDLIIEALERHEDMSLSAIAQTREEKPGKIIKHVDAWK